MGYYVAGHLNKGKVEYLISEHNGTEAPMNLQWADIPLGKAAIVVIDNGPFQAAGFAFDEEEFLEFTDPTDPRPKRIVLVDRTWAVQQTNYEEV